MKDKIKIDKDGLIVFIGSMNAMPMMYAWELRRQGYSVLYFVDAPVSDALSRPENHFSDISYPYPDWIIELKIPTQMLLPYFSAFFARKILRIINAHADKLPSCFFLNGFFVSLAPWLQNNGKVIALSHGSDLDVWANKSNAEELAGSFGKRSVFKFLPKIVARKLIVLAVERQYSGFSAADAVIYFPKGFNRAGDDVVKSLKDDGVDILERYDISFEPLKGVSRDFKESGPKIVIFSGVRFLYRTFPDGNRGYSKGNDMIIRGVAEYSKMNRQIEVHFVEKGEDVAHAKELCLELGIGDLVVWHKEMPFNKLIDLYLAADICFDQVGAHWMGAIGAYALFLGKPLISNVDRIVELGVFPEENPIISASNETDILHALVDLGDESVRRSLNVRSKEFVEREMGCVKLINRLFLMA